MGKSNLPASCLYTMPPHGKFTLQGMTFLYQTAPYSLRKKSMRYLILGGAAVYRCDHQPVFNNGFSR